MENLCASILSCDQRKEQNEDDDFHFQLNR
jgi:hypothetical protein